MVDEVMPGGSSEANWSQGASLLDQVAFSNAVYNNAMIIAFGVSGQLALHGQVQTAYGRFGKLLTGLALGQPSNGGGASFGSYVTPMSQLPSDPSYLTPLWDPSNDALPPNDASYQTSLLPVSSVLQLPQPMPIQPGSTMVGLWMQPSLLSITFGLPRRWLALYNTTYTVIYDDGIKDGS